MTEEECKCFIPPLSAFAFLFRYLLVTINDAEFYGDSSSSSGSSRWMPFSLQELVSIAMALRDVALGLIELAFPDSRLVVGEEYANAVR